MIISAEKKAPPDSTRTPSSASRRKSLQAQSTSVIGESEEDPVRQAVGAGIEGPDERISSLDPEADDDIRLVGLGQARGQATDVGDLELAIAIRERNEVVPGGREA